MDKEGQAKILNNIPNSAELYMNAFSHMPNLMYFLDKDCAFIDCNNHFLKVLGIDSIKENAVGSIYKHMIEQEFASPERTQLLKTADIEAILSGKSEYDHVETPFFNRQKEVVYYLSSRIPLLNDKGEVVALLVILTDITEYTRMVDQLEKIKKQLQMNNASSTFQAEASLSQSQSNVSTSTPDKEQATHSTPPRILIVEDNLIAQKAERSMLMQMDCIVDTADSGTKCEELFVPGKYDLVFMDIGLEGKSGYILAKQIRLKEKDTGHRVPIIALTAYQADVVKFDCDYYQMEGAITKPLTAEQLKQIIQRYIFNIDINISGLKTIENGPH